MAVDLRQTHFRFGKDDGTESTHTFWQVEDINHSQQISADWTFLLRFTEQEAGGTAAANTDAVFQYNKNGAGWIDITTTSLVVKAVAVGAFAGGDNCTKRLSGTGTFESSGKGCTEDGSSGGTANDIAANGNSETEAGLQVVFANVANNDTIQLRFRSPDWTVTYTITPTLTVLVAANVTVIPGLFNLATTFFMPAILVSDNKIVVPSIFSLIVSTFTPTILISDNKVAVPGTLGLALTTFIPTILVSDNKVIVPDILSLVLATFVPLIVVSDNKTVTPGALALTLTVFTPTIVISDNKVVTPDAFALVLSTFAPIIVIAGNVTVIPGLFNLTLIMFAPTILNAYNWTVEALVEGQYLYIEALTSSLYNTRRDITNLSGADRTQAIADMKATYPTSNTYRKHTHTHGTPPQSCVLEAV